MQLHSICIPAVYQLYSSCISAVLQLYCSCIASVLQLYCSFITAVLQMTGRQQEVVRQLSGSLVRESSNSHETVIKFYILADLPLICTVFKILTNLVFIFSIPAFYSLLQIFQFELQFDLSLTASFKVV